MKVLYCTTSSNLKSGASWSLLRMIIQLKRLGVTPFVVLQTHGDLEDELKKNRISYKVIHEKWLGSWLKYSDEEKNKKASFLIKNRLKAVINYFAYIKLKRLIVKNDFDLIHLNGLPTVNAAKIAIQLKKKYVWHIREFLEDDLNYSFVNKTEARELLSKAESVIAISKSVKEKFTSQLGLTNISVVYNGVDSGKYYCKRSIFEDKGKYHIAIIGRITKSKGQLILLRAINNLKEKDKVVCEIIGPYSKNDNYYTELTNYVTNNNLNVKFINYVPNVEDYMKKNDIVCVCSKREAFGRVTIESMLAGCLVIGSNRGGTSELINDAKTGYLYDSSNDIKSLNECLSNAISNRLNSKSIALAGQKQALLFSDEANAREIKKIYDEAIGNL